MNTICDTPLPELLDTLVACFDEELERQENVLRICRAQGEAARNHDVEALQARTEALTELFEEASAAEERRVPVLAAIVEYYELTPEKQTLSGLIEHVPEPWNHRLAEFQTTLRRVLMETKAEVRRNARYMRRSLKTIDNALDLLTGVDSGEPAAYNEAGAEPTRGQARTPARIDTQG